MQWWEGLGCSSGRVIKFRIILACMIQLSNSNLDFRRYLVAPTFRIVVEHNDYDKLFRRKYTYSICIVNSPRKFRIRQVIEIEKYSEKLWFCHNEVTSTWLFANHNFYMCTKKILDLGRIYDLIQVGFRFDSSRKISWIKLAMRPESSFVFLGVVWIHFQNCNFRKILLN